MCHLILLLPVISLAIFWLMPLQYSLPIYGFILALSVFLYWLIMRAMRQPLNDGFLSLVGTRAEVVSTPKPNTPASYLVRTQGELWSAQSRDTLQSGDRVNIIAVKGISIIVERSDDGE